MPLPELVGSKFGGRDPLQLACDFRGGFAMRFFVKIFGPLVSVDCFLTLLRLVQLLNFAAMQIGC